MSHSLYLSRATLLRRRPCNGLRKAGACRCTRSAFTRRFEGPIRRVLGRSIGFGRAVFQRPFFFGHSGRPAVWRSRRPRVNPGPSIASSGRGATGRRPEPTPCSPSNAASKTGAGPTSSIGELAARSRLTQKYEPHPTLETNLAKSYRTSQDAANRTLKRRINADPVHRLDCHSKKGYTGHTDVYGRMK